ncbi:MAG: alpha/beta hydrolase [Lachnospiraceae bacterium]|nr:alpha/beta hydrolase [Lachnospiraceae bacterium]
MTKKKYRKIKTLIKWLLGIASAVTAAEFVVAYRIFRQSFRRKEDIYADDAPADRDYTTEKYQRRYMEGLLWNQEIRGKEITISAEDGTVLYGMYYPADDAKRTILLAHGYHSTWQKDFSEIVRYYHEHGANLLMIEQRSHRRSGGVYIQMGVRESEDIVKWAEYLNETYGDQLPLYFHGMSMGAATVLMSQGQLLPGNMTGIIADCGYTSPEEIVKSVARHGFHLPELPAEVMVAAVRLYTRWFAKYDLAEKEIPKILSHAKIPVLFIHGTGDTFVPTEMTVRNFTAAACPKSLLLVDHAPHAMSWFFDTERYMKALEDFFRENENPAEV